MCYREDYPANVHPWMNLAAQGVEVRFVQPRQYGNVTVDDVARVVDSRTRLVSLASAHFVSGWRLDVEAMGQFLHDRGILFSLDAIQTLGAIRTNLQHVDFAAADAHKWLLGPLGIAVFFVRKEHFDRLRPPLVGAHSAPTPDYFVQEPLRFWPDARRYEPGSFNIVGIVGLQAALRLILELGIGEIESRVLALARYAVSAGRERGLTVVGPVMEGDLTGLVSFDGDRVAEWHDRLSRAGIVASLRRRHGAGMCVRLSPHFYNRTEDLAAAFALV